MAGLFALVVAVLAFAATLSTLTLPWATLLALGVAMLAHPLAERLVRKSR